MLLRWIEARLNLTLSFYTARTKTHKTRDNLETILNFIFWPWYSVWPSNLDNFVFLVWSRSWPNNIPAQISPLHFNDVRTRKAYLPYSIDMWAEFFSGCKVFLPLMKHRLYNDSALPHRIVRTNMWMYRSGTVNSKSFVSKVLLPIKWKFELTVYFKHEILGKL